MKYLNSTFKYIAGHWLYFLLMSAAPALAVAFLYRPTMALSFIDSLDVSRTYDFGSVYYGISSFCHNWWMTLIAVSVVMAFAIIVIVTVDRDMKIGHFSAGNPLKKLNENSLMLIPIYFFTLVVIELGYLVLSVLISLWILIFNSNGLLYMASVVSLFLVLLVELIFFSLTLLWIPHMLQTGYTGARAFSAAIRKIRGNFGTVFFHMLLIAMPVLVLAVLEQMLKLYLGWLVIMAAVIIILPFFSVYPFVVYYDVEDLDREDLKNISIWKINK